MQDDVDDPPSPPSPPLPFELPRPGLIVTSDLTNFSSSHSPDVRPLDFFAYDGRIYAESQPFDLKGIVWFGAESRHGPPQGLAEHSIDFYLDWMATHRFSPPAQRPNMAVHISHPRSL